MLNPGLRVTAYALMTSGNDKTPKQSPLILCVAWEGSAPIWRAEAVIPGRNAV